MDTNYQTQKARGTTKVPARAQVKSSAPIADRQSLDKIFRGKPSKDRDGNYI